MVDDGSTDGTAEIARALGTEVIRHNDNRGIAAARNTALRVLENEFIASVDSDCVADKGWLGACMAHLGPPGVAGVGGRLLERGMRLPDKWRARHLKQNPYGERVRESIYVPPVS